MRTSEPNREIQRLRILESRIAREDPNRLDAEIIPDSIAIRLKLTVKTFFKIFRRKFYLVFFIKIFWRVRSAMNIRQVSTEYYSPAICFRAYYEHRVSPCAPKL
jgi:hypothetical protein